MNFMIRFRLHLYHFNLIKIKKIEKLLCRYKLDTLGLSINDFIWWSSTHVQIREDLVKNRLGLPCYRLS